MSSTGPARGESPAIDISGVTKKYGEVTALDGLDLEVARGEVHGFLGPNGAGKSTTMRILLGILRHDSGTVRMLGGDPWSDAVALHRRLAYVPGDVELWPNLTGGEAIDLFARLRGGVDAAKRDELIERFDLDPRKKGRTYSKGNRQKVALISALASDVDLLLLDEPTAGLDPLMEVVFQECVREAKDAGVTVLLSSHILAQVEILADRISIIRKGTVVESGTLQDLRHLSRTTVTALTDKPLTELARRQGVHDLHAEGQQTRFEVDSEHLPAIMRDLAAHDVQALTATPPTLEQLLLRHYGDELRGDELGGDGPGGASTNGAGGNGSGKGRAGRARSTRNGAAS
ncbi:ABC transporter ATP-binding protein [Prauserella rugosa]|uniref:ABC-2 type transport system ATP-binding protein n=1 Tax=Prauserella rugosa TaxID=43354 RepID=A0A660CHV3_9PSEU|nr:ABC transporter ATP-binding protein [Prauserella rugosa]TWH21213.1 ABC-2 type transport system ATP-binding protein [Prauserella rugosa]